MVTGLGWYWVRLVHGFRAYGYGLQKVTTTNWTLWVGWFKELVPGLWSLELTKTADADATTAAAAADVGAAAAVLRFFLCLTQLFVRAPGP